MTAWDEFSTLAKGFIDSQEQVLMDCRQANISLSGQVSSLVAQLNDSRLQLAAALQRIKELETPPQTLKTYFGACPKAGGTSLAAQTTVVTKYGKGCSVRQFFGVLGSAIPRNPDVGLLHASFKDYNLNNITQAKVKTALTNLKAGDIVELGHESDNDGLTGTALTARWNLKNKFYDCVKAVRPDLHVSLTMVGYSFDPKSGKNAQLEQWIANVKANVLGVDCDGVRPTQLPYTDYTAETKTAVAFLDKYGTSTGLYQYLAIPEFGCPRIPSADPLGEVRAAYHDFYAELWKATGKCISVTLYEYNSSPNYSLETTAEINGWKAHV